MKKNVKFLGVTAAALLAVAPVVSNGVANAAISTDKNVPVAPSTTPENQNVINFASTMSAVSTSTSVSSLTNADAVRSALNVNGSNAAIAGVGQASVVKAGTNEAVTTLTAGGHYELVATVALNGLKANTQYTLKQGNDSLTTDGTKSNRNGVIENVKVTIPFTAYDAAVVGQPYFYNAGTTIVIGNGQAANGKATWATTTSQILANASAMVEAHYTNENGSVGKAYITTTAADVATQLQNQGVSVTNGNISSTAKSFVVTLTAVNPNNNQTATVRVQFTKDANTKGYPTIAYNGTDVQQGSLRLNPTTVVAPQFKAGSAEARNFRAGDNFKAYPTDATSGNLTLQVVTNKVNPDVAGVYPVTVRATNANGYTTDFSYNVTILPVATNADKTATIHYAAGYGVNVWNVLSDTTVAFTGKHINSGAKVTIHESKTVNGVSYTRITDDGEFKTAGFWVQTQYLSDAWKDQSSNNNSSSNTNNNGEEKLSGVLTVRYNGKGSVGLVNANGKYTGKYVVKNARYKVFAKKTINGRVCYRIGTQNQWIPAEFSALD